VRLCLAAALQRNWAALYRPLALSLPPLYRQGGLEVDKVVELQNGGLAKVLSIDDEHVVLDANNMLAGLERSIEVELLHIERPDP
jgi:FKBP-type peptidyl-prolyl cis-trans isomerase 2